MAVPWRDDDVFGIASYADLWLRKRHFPKTRRGCWGSPPCTPTHRRKQHGAEIKIFCAHPKILIFGPRPAAGLQFACGAFITRERIANRSIEQAGINLFIRHAIILITLVDIYRQKRSGPTRAAVSADRVRQQRITKASMPGKGGAAKNPLKISEDDLRKGLQG